MASQNWSQTKTAKEIERWLRDDLRRHHDVGVGSAVLNLLFEPRNPFNPKQRRRPRKLAVLICLVVFSMAASFAYFTLTSSPP